MILKAQLSGAVFPSVQRLLHEYNLDISNLLKFGTGPKGRLTKGDVLNYVAVKNMKPNPTPLPPLQPKPVSPSDASAKPSSIATACPMSSGVPLRVNRKRTGPAAYTEVPTDNMRRVIAHRLTESKTTVPHAYATREIDMAQLTVLRKKLNAGLEESAKLSVTDFLIRACALALKQVPEANSTYSAGTQETSLLSNVDISLAVALDSGLITPIIFGADTKGIASIAATSKDLVKRARNKGLKPHEYQGGTFSISNLGMFGITEFSAVINPPQSMILAVGGPLQSVSIASSTSATPSINTSIRVTLSCDARAVSADVAAKWLDVFEQILTNPTRMML